MEEYKIYEFRILNSFGKFIKIVNFEFSETMSKEEMEEEVKDSMVYYENYSKSIKVERL